MRKIIATVALGGLLILGLACDPHSTSTMNESPDRAKDVITDEDTPVENPAGGTNPDTLPSPREPIAE